MTQTLDADTVTEFARAVRRQLLDLGPDTLDELTDGLEADLGDKVADGDALGDPAAYAAELRAAAGFGARVPRSTRVLDRISSAWHGLLARLAPVLALPVVAQVVAMLVALRPVWWLVRGWALFYVLTGFKTVPGNEWDYPVLAAIIVLSVQWGRGKWLPWRWSRGGVIALSVIAALALPSLMTLAIQRFTFSDTMDIADYIPYGLLLDQQRVTNIFAYGSDGRPLGGVQLFDQNGNPLSVRGAGSGETFVWDESSGDSRVVLPSDSPGATTGLGEGWNVFPLDATDFGSIDPETGKLYAWATQEKVSPPFQWVQSLDGATAAPQG